MSTRTEHQQQKPRRNPQEMKKNDHRRITCYACLEARVTCENENRGVCDRCKELRLPGGAPIRVLPVAATCPADAAQLFKHHYTPFHGGFHFCSHELSFCRAAVQFFIHCAPSLDSSIHCSFIRFADDYIRSGSACSIDQACVPITSLCSSKSTFVVIEH
ncbi:hypothetical protein R3P38DRAFT_3175489 [Favolaschia claudopus]|uniref:Zn(2)-C6 fungal-type domain-containing protein n=1 Tax=Favolaschia claudopus TaxID=2862362 RepID=A0AAW0D3K8_9AGAR